MRKSALGFTLVELMIAVAIIGILAGIAYPAYKLQALRSGRADVKVGLSDVAQQMQRCFTANNTYKPAAAGTCDVVDKITSGPGWITTNRQYSIKIAQAADHTDATYKLTAEAIAATKQSKDLECKKFTLDQTGVRTAVDSSGAVATNNCW